MDFFAFLYPIEWVVAWIMYFCHQGLTFLGFSDGPGPAWVLSIVGLVIIIRILLIPLFFKQIKASRGMQLLQPEMQAIQKKYKGKTDPASREAMSRETMELYRKHGTNPFASCMPILLQSPIFFALFRVLNSLKPISDGTYSRDSIGPIDASVASDIESSSVFGAKLSDVFLQTDDLQTRIVIAVLILAMCATTFFTQRQLTMKNMPKAALEGPMASTQKMMLYVFPFIFAVSGVNFPVGVLVYWTTTNLWSMGQQFYTIRRMPAPGSEAERLLKERQARKRAAKGVVEDATPVIEQPRGQRQQPKRKDRQKSAPRPVGTVSATTPEDAPVEDAPADKPAPGGAAKGGSGTGASKPAPKKKKKQK
ncbi:MAG: membrane protein insertase YidC [Cellulosimicrobium funkei]|uniref:Membrane protein insertase YidC n=2 Tax=Actinomycetes TaxID=1760 RepID=A0AAV5P4W3_CELCE|nr:membrane protein insertase YidC [Cellulosimicrobium cellulans]QDP74151.1 membrane protein insertase YidC [Cellulosimicrobium cellulans]GLY57058.1 membrane protein insertase YidC [Cellulosimicrobium cellulans]